MKQKNLFKDGFLTNEEPIFADFSEILLSIDRDTTLRLMKVSQKILIESIYSFHEVRQLNLYHIKKKDKTELVKFYDFSLL